jgi:hypothetical protein
MRRRGCGENWRKASTNKPTKLMEQVNEMLCRLKEKVYFELESLTLHCQKCGF